MFKKFLNLLFFISIVSTVNAQEKLSKFSPEILIGPSFPLGKFADKNYSDPKDPNPSGMADIGWETALRLRYKFNPNIAAIASFTLNMNKQNETSYKNYLTAQNNTMHYDVSTNSWILYKLMGGGLFFPESSSMGKIRIQLLLLAGIFKTAMPGYIINHYYQSGAFAGTDYRPNQGLPWQFCYQGGLVFRYPFLQKFYWILSANCFNASIVQKGFYIQFNNVPTLVPITRTYHFTSANALFGIGMKL